MKSKIKKEEFEEIYRMLDKVSPVDFDCGKICGAICCRDVDGEDMGMYLLPGEEKIHDRKDKWLEWSKERAEDYDFPDSWKGTIYFVKCADPSKCRRI